MFQTNQISIVMHLAFHMLSLFLWLVPFYFLFGGTAVFVQLFHRRPVVDSIAECWTQTVASHDFDPQNQKGRFPRCFVQNPLYPFHSSVNFGIKYKTSPTTYQSLEPFTACRYPPDRRFSLKSRFLQNPHLEIFTRRMGSFRCLKTKTTWTRCDLEEASDARHNCAMPQCRKRSTGCSLEMFRKCVVCVFFGGIALAVFTITVLQRGGTKMFHGPMKPWKPLAYVRIPKMNHGPVSTKLIWWFQAETKLGTCFKAVLIWGALLPRISNPS